MIINAIGGTDEVLYSGSYDGKLKAWTDLKEVKPALKGEVNAGSCINALCIGDDGTVYLALSDGSIKLVKFS